MFSIRTAWKSDASDRNGQRQDSAFESLDAARNLYMQAVEEIDKALADMAANVDTTAPEFQRGEAANLMQYVGSVVATAQRRAWQAGEEAMKAAIYVGGMEPTETE